MKKITEILFPLALVAAAACSEKVMPDVVDGQGTDGAGVSFRVSARAWETEGKELVRLYIAERLPEHNHQGEDLHCDTFMDLEWTDGAGTDGSSVSDPGYVYTLEGMLAQWYKFAFVAVPDGIGWTVTVGEESYTEVLDGKSMLQDGFSEGLCDFNGIYIDYTRVMEAQEDDVDLIRRGDDLHVYRKIIDRWLYPDELRTEDVTLTRMTGLLSLNMGIPEDQFPGKVTEITVLMTSVPVKAYLRDMADTARLTASAANAQALRFRIVTDETEKDSVFAAINWAAENAGGAN